MMIMAMILVKDLYNNLKIRRSVTGVITQFSLVSVAYVVGRRPNMY